MYKYLMYLPYLGTPYLLRIPYLMWGFWVTSTGPLGVGFGG
jgi:hypothetical protein